MKILFTLFILASQTSLLTAQTVQKTKVRELNSNKQPLFNVYIEFEGAPPRFSDLDGNISLETMLSYYRRLRSGTNLLIAKILSIQKLAVQIN
jgi:hypothetical protein